MESMEEQLTESETQYKEQPLYLENIVIVQQRSNKAGKVKNSHEKAYRCDLCEGTFTQASSLNRHRKIHTIKERRTHKCSHCSSAYSRIDNLRQHIRIKHSEQKVGWMARGRDAEQMTAEKSGANVQEMGEEVEGDDPRYSHVIQTDDEEYKVVLQAAGDEVDIKEEVIEDNLLHANMAVLPEFMIYCKQQNDVLKEENPLN